MDGAGAPTPIEVTTALLRARPLPRHEEGDDKEGRGRVLVVAGSREIPGAALLASTAVLRVGAGKVQIATLETLVPALAYAMPEARVIGLPETADGGIAPEAADILVPRFAKCAAVLIGPGMMDRTAVAGLTARLLDCTPGPAFVIDAAPLSCLRDCREALARHERVAITPHAGEMASLMGVGIETVESDPLGMARKAAALLRATVALKGGCTRIVAPDGEAFENRHGDIGLATSGSGDVLAGFVAGLMARGAGPLDALLWAVRLHAEAGERLARSRGPLGYLARELPGEAPAILAEWS